MTLPDAQPRRPPLPGPGRRRQAAGAAALPGVDRPQRLRPGRDPDRDVRVHGRPAALPAQPGARLQYMHVPRPDRREAATRRRRPAADVTFWLSAPPRRGRDRAGQAEVATCADRGDDAGGVRDRRRARDAAVLAEPRDDAGRRGGAAGGPRPTSWLAGRGLACFATTPAARRRAALRPVDAGARAARCCCGWSARSRASASTRADPPLGVGGVGRHRLGGVRGRPGRDRRAQPAGDVVLHVPAGHTASLVGRHAGRLAAVPPRPCPREGQPFYSVARRLDARRRVHHRRHRPGACTRDASTTRCSACPRACRGRRSRSPAARSSPADDPLVVEVGRRRGLGASGHEVDVVRRVAAPTTGTSWSTGPPARCDVRAGRPRARRRPAGITAPCRRRGARCGCPATATGGGPARQRRRAGRSRCCVDPMPFVSRVGQPAGRDRRRRRRDGRRREGARPAAAAHPRPRRDRRGLRAAGPRGGARASPGSACVRRDSADEAGGVRLLRRAGGRRRVDGAVEFADWCPTDGDPRARSPSTSTSAAPRRAGRRWSRRSTRASRWSPRWSHGPRRRRRASAAAGAAGALNRYLNPLERRPRRARGGRSAGRCRPARCTRCCSGCPASSWSRTCVLFAADPVTGKRGEAAQRIDLDRNALRVLLRPPDPGGDRWLRVQARDGPRPRHTGAAAASGCPASSRTTSSCSASSTAFDDASRRSSPPSTR